MKREYGISRCGLACCLCTENASCAGCAQDGCPGASGCENLLCSKKKNLPGCWACGDTACRKGLLQKIKPRVFCAYVRKYGADTLMDRLAENEKRGVVYHRCGVNGDYDEFTDEDALFSFIQNGPQK